MNKFLGKLYKKIIKFISNYTHHEHIEWKPAEDEDSNDSEHHLDHLHEGSGKKREKYT